jgi:sugar/nucleoside kinase (ribokinase family)
VVDTTGAGDAFAAGFPVARSRGPTLSRPLASASPPAPPSTWG